MLIHEVSITANMIDVTAF